LHDRVEHILPAIGAVDIAGTQRAAFQITELIEHEQRVITGAGVMAVPHNDPAHRRIMAQTSGVVHILVPGEATKYRLSEQPGQCVPTIFTGVCVG
jgi:D-serine deaminase-like pyridoxal phosphate-dependent protein